MPFSISAHTFPIHLLLLGWPFKCVSQRLGHRNAESSGIYTNVLTFDRVIFY
ncbi:hypothetical protein [Gilvimarinus algae]|uniref:Uncharacterized protein n=1 Tax=Gilvimarinus algae TaxID=3058037 RepID=A0ABT8TIB0_9GAMM|nr:hypothetical protein [Gilvimarinus sp. SDUM040014]MDO3382421.1 hypothetical protein [Gilvimarinus sp. SDUM040014]